MKRTRVRRKVARLLVGDAVSRLSEMEEGSVRMCVTSPPYFGLRDYGVDGQVGLEPTPDEFVAKLVEVFREVRRVLTDDGTLWVNLGDSYAGGGGGNYSKSKKQTAHNQHQTNVRNRGGWLDAAGLKAKDLIGIPWRVAFALQADGWYLRQDIIWHKPNPMPSSVRDRCTTAHEYIFMLSKSYHYYYDQDAVKEPVKAETLERYAAGFRTTDRDKGTEGVSIGANKRTRYGIREGFSGGATRNRRSVWSVATRPYKGAHFATYPPDLIRPCILAGSAQGDLVLDPFSGAATTGIVATQESRKYVGIELNPEYHDIAVKRFYKECPGAKVDVER